MKEAANNWESKIAIITSRNYFAGDMIPIEENIYQLSVAMVLRRNSYFTEVFNGVIYKLLTNGYISELYSNFRFKKNSQRTSTGYLSMDDVVGLFRLCLCGYVLAIVVFSCEVFFFYITKKKVTARK